MPSAVIHRGREWGAAAFHVRTLEPEAGRAAGRPHSRAGSRHEEEELGRGWVVKQLAASTNLRRKNVNMLRLRKLIFA